MYSVACGIASGRRTPETVHLREVRVLELARQLRLGRAALGGAGDDLVLDVGDVADEAHVEPTPLEVATNRVVHDRRAAVPDVRDVVDGRAADVDRDLAGLTRDELDVPAASCRGRGRPA